MHFYKTLLLFIMQKVVLKKKQSHCWILAKWNFFFLELIAFHFRKKQSILKRQVSFELFNIPLKPGKIGCFFFLVFSKKMTTFCFFLKKLRKTASLGSLREDKLLNKIVLKRKCENWAFFILDLSSAFFFYLIFFVYFATSIISYWKKTKKLNNKKNC